MAPNSNPLVLVLGGTGRAGRSIVQGLVDSGNFRVAALVRPCSLSKPKTDALRALGVEIRTGELTDDAETLKAHLNAVSILVSAVHPAAILDQKNVFRAAKEAGVGRIVPSDWGTAGARGVRMVYDLNLDIHDFLKELGVPWTIIDVGWWMQMFLPLPSRGTIPGPAFLKPFRYTIVGDGGAKNLVTDWRHMGTYAARILADPRTLNRHVIVWEDEVTQNEGHELAEQLSGDAEYIRSQRIYAQPDRFLKDATAAAAEVAQAGDPSNVDTSSIFANAALAKMVVNQYFHSMLALEENTLEFAKKLGYLSVQDLYPDFPKHTLKEFAKEFYSMPQPGSEFNE